MSDSFPQYLHQLEKLHELISAGKGDSTEADEIRDEMDYSWKKLTEKQQESARVLSAAFYDTRDRI
jgi:Spy/CpxP family protein refolding chaperone